MHGQNFVWWKILANSRIHNSGLSDLSYVKNAKMQSMEKGKVMQIGQEFHL